MGIYLVFSLVSIIVLTLRVNKRGQYHFGILPRPASGNLWPQTKTKKYENHRTAQTSRRAMKNPISLHVKSGKRVVCRTGARDKITVAALRCTLCAYNHVQASAMTFCTK